MCIVILYLTCANREGEEIPRCIWLLF